MRLNLATVRTLYKQCGWSQNELACRIGIGCGSLSNVLSGRRGVGRKTLSGLLRVFPDESAASMANDRRAASQVLPGEAGHVE